MGNNKAVIFDVDGTIWDASDQVARSWSKTLSNIAGEKVVIATEAMRKTMGLMMDEIAKIILPESLGGLDRNALLERCMNEENAYLSEHPGVYYPGVAECIEHIAKHVKVYILSNAQTGYIEAMLANARFKPFIAGFACYGDQKLEKADNLAYLMKKEGIDEAVYVGDTAHDEEETHKAGLPFIHAAYGYGKAVNPEGSAPAPSAVYPIAKQLLNW